jgi:hypothetical protein
MLQPLRSLNIFKIISKQDKKRKIVDLYVQSQYVFNRVVGLSCLSSKVLKPPIFQLISEGYPRILDDDSIFKKAIIENPKNPKEILRDLILTNGVQVHHRIPSYEIAQFTKFNEDQKLIGGSIPEFSQNPIFTMEFFHSDETNVISHSGYGCVYSLEVSGNDVASKILNSEVGYASNCIIPKSLVFKKEGRLELINLNEFYAELFEMSEVEVVKFLQTLYVNSHKKFQTTNDIQALLKIHHDLITSVQSLI